jgi:hypothetical protein
MISLLIRLITTVALLSCVNTPIAIAADDLCTSNTTGKHTTQQTSNANKNNHIKQSGINNTIIKCQFGKTNNIDIEQKGENNKAATIQIGGSNTARIIQGGSIQ